jgi:membrane protein
MSQTQKSSKLLDISAFSNIKTAFSTASARTKTGLRQVDHLLGGGLHVLLNANRSFTQAHATYAAASIAFFAFFSLFPLLLILVVIGSSFLKSDEVYSEILALIARGIPISQDLIETNLARLLDRRNAVTAVSLVSLVWSASLVFNTLAYNINLAWPRGQRRNLVQNYLISLASIGIFAILLCLSFLVDTFIKLLPDLSFQQIGLTFRELLYYVLPVLVIFMLLAALYRWVPKNRSHWKAVLTSASSPTWPGKQPAIWSHGISVVGW